MGINNKFLKHNLNKNGETIDHSLLWVVLCLLVFGLVMVYSATVSGREMRPDEPMYFLMRQSVFIGIGTVLCLILFRFFPMKRWLKLTPVIFIISMILLLAVLFIGTKVGSTRRWIPLAGFNMQPAEVYKLAVIFYLASFMTRRQEFLRYGKKMLLPGAFLAVGTFLILCSGDLGSVVIIGALIFCMLILGGLKFLWILAVFAVMAGVFLVAILIAPYRMKRLMTFMDPLQDAYGAGYQTIHSMFALANGSWFGVGLGEGRERFFLPEAHTDFILALIGEELGIVMVCFLSLVFCWLVYRSFTIGRQARDLELYFSAYVAMGIGLWLGLQSFFHIGVNLVMLPTKGLTLPFISYGGSSLIMTMVCVMLLLCVDYENRRKIRGFTL